MLKTEPGYCTFCLRKNVIQVWNDMRGSKSWLIFFYVVVCFSPQFLCQIWVRETHELWERSFGHPLYVWTHCVAQSDCVLNTDLIFATSCPLCVMWLDQNILWETLTQDCWQYTTPPPPPRWVQLIHLPWYQYFAQNFSSQIVWVIKDFYL